ncbi:MAG: virulence RhuM family protein [Bacteroidales bacterium]|nr:virulence RhuM family protein [Bacteroidales bacterium]
MFKRKESWQASRAAVAVNTELLNANNILESGELERNSVVAENATNAADGKTYTVSYYNLDMIISVGYRVNSHRGVQFLLMTMANGCFID